MESNPPYDYSAIVRRPRFELPEGKKIAVYCGISVEHYAWGRPALSLAQFTAELVPDPLNYGWRDYGPRVGIFRLMEIFDRFDLKATVLLNSEVCDRYPEVVEEGVKRGWTWVGHGGNNSTWLVGMDHEAELAYIKEVTDRIEKATGSRPRGWLGPALTESADTNQILVEAGYRYSLNWGIDDEPVPLKVAQGELLSVPYSSELNDIPAFNLQGQSAPDFAGALIDQFDQMLEEGEERPRVMGFGLHPFLTGQPYRARHLAGVLEHMTARREEVWFTNPDEIAAHYLASRGEGAGTP
jgi:peptidoglycan/xylan/chitin deacetylase (PgdA/CDA1 family)